MFGFGLVHGLGLSTRLQDLGLPEDGIVGRVVLFNVGVELGQLAALSVIVGVGTFLGRRVPRLASASRVAFASLVAAGLVAAAVLSFPSENSRDDNESLADTGAASTSCKEAGYEPPPFLGGGHPAKSFYEPGEKASGNDLVHVMYDGYVIVTYADDLPSRKRQELEEWVLKGELAVIAASDDDQVEPIRAVTARRQLTCSAVDLAGLRSFRDRWFESLRG